MLGFICKADYFLTLPCFSPKIKDSRAGAEPDRYGKLPRAVCEFTMFLVIKPKYTAGWRPHAHRLQEIVLVAIHYTTNTVLFVVFSVVGAIANTFNGNCACLGTLSCSSAWWPFSTSSCGYGLPVLEERFLAFSSLCTFI